MLNNFLKKPGTVGFSKRKNILYFSNTSCPDKADSSVP